MSFKKQPQPSTKRYYRNSAIQGFDIPSSKKVSELVTSYKKVAMLEKADRDKAKLSRKHKHFTLLVCYVKWNKWLMRFILESGIN